MDSGSVAWDSKKNEDCIGRLQIVPALNGRFGCQPEYPQVHGLPELNRRPMLSKAHRPARQDYAESYAITLRIHFSPGHLKKTAGRWPGQTYTPPVSGETGPVLADTGISQQEF